MTTTKGRERGETCTYCMIVPGRYGMSTIDGIDLDAQYDCWRELEAIEAYAKKHSDELDKAELEKRKKEIVGRYDKLTLATEAREVRKHLPQRVVEWYEPRERMAKNYTPGYSVNGKDLAREKHVLSSGRVAYSQRELDEVIRREFSGINFPVRPAINPKLKTPGKTTGTEAIPGFPDGGFRIKSIEIGLQESEDVVDLYDTILHEAFEAKLMMRGDARLRDGDAVVHEYIDRAIARYAKLRGWM